MTILAIIAGLMGWVLMVWNPKSKKQWFWAVLMFLVVLVSFIVSRSLTR